MPPKPVKKPTVHVVRPSISSDLLLYVPEDAVLGFQDRIETGINWNDSELGVRHHREKFYKANQPSVLFTEALQDKISKSYLGGFLKNDGSLTLDQQWDLLLPIKLWDVEKFANPEGKICFDSDNFITDNLIGIIKKAVQRKDRKLLKKEFKNVCTLRITDAKLTGLDASLTKFRLLESLNLGSNYISVVDTSALPPKLRLLELHNNLMANVDSFIKILPTNLMSLGLSRNLLTSDGIAGLSQLTNIVILDLSDNDICELTPLLDALSHLPRLNALSLAGNPCSVCTAYAATTVNNLQRLQWLDGSEILTTDRPSLSEPYEVHPDDLRTAHFVFSVLRVMSAPPPPPRAEKGVVCAFYVEVEIPLLDVVRRQFLMHKRHESLIEMLPPPEDDFSMEKMSSHINRSKVVVDQELEPPLSDIYQNLETVNQRMVHHYTIVQSARLQWNKILIFPDPVIRIFCPDLRALRDTFRTQVTVRLVYAQTITPAKPAKAEKKSAHSLYAVPIEQHCVLATIQCSLRNPLWSQQQQHFHWDDCMGTNQAIHWGDGDLSAVQYGQTTPRPVKGKEDTASVSRQQVPDNLTCQFGFGIETLQL